MKLGLIISFLLYFVMLMGNRGCNGCLEKERIGLLEIKHYILSLKGDYHKELGSWVDDRDSNCCVWKRVKCSSGHIAELSIQSLLYATPDPNMLNVSLFRPFEELRLLDLSYNNFQGWIGNEGFPGLKKLETLDLSWNHLNSSSILPSLNGLTALTTLNIGHNHIFNDFFAQGFPRLKRLETLDLSWNRLNSSILPSLNGLTALTTLKLGSNSMENFSAQGFSRSKELEVLDLSGNMLNCSIIRSLHRFTTLRSLILSDNRFSCSLSTLDFSKFSRLELLDLGFNQFTGSLHVEDVQHLRNLKMLSLSYNQVNGSIEGLCNLKDLVELDISNNMFGAKLPSLTIPRKKIGILDDVHSNGCLDAMRSSSPTHKKISMDIGHGVASSGADAAYLTWLLEFPSAIGAFEQITNLAKGKKIALFLDYDGTLSPIVDNPERAFMSDNMRVAVKSVAEYFPTAIISGRSREKVHEFVGLTDLHYAGSHGMDIIGPLRPSISDNHPNCIRSTDEKGKEVNLFQPAAEFLPMIDKSWELVAQRVSAIMKDYPNLRLTHGRKVLEVRPMIDWDKGKAVRFLLESLGLSDADDVLAIYIGDDRTDEDAFKVLSEDNKGFGILVSSAPKESKAVYSLCDPSEVMEFLKSLVVWKSSSIV